MLKCKLYIVRGNPVELPIDLHTSYEAAELAMAFRPLLTVTEWEYGDIEHRKGGRTVCGPRRRRCCTLYCLKVIRWHSNDGYSHSFILLMEEAEVTPQSFAAALQSVSFAAQRWLTRAVDSLATGVAPELDQVPLHDLDEQPPDDILFQHLYKIMKLYHNQLSEGQVSHVHKAIAYIQEHIGDDLSLQQVASYVHLHPVI